MGTHRLYTGSDGQSHVEEIDFEKEEAWVKGIATSSIVFRSQPARRPFPWFSPCCKPLRVTPRAVSDPIAMAKK